MALSFMIGAGRALTAPAAKVEYELLSSTYYSVWRDSDSAFGTLFVSVRSAVVTVELHLKDQETEAFSMDFDEWQDGLRRRGLLVTPMIWRQGACVENKTASGRRELACIVPPPTTEGGLPPETNFSPSDCSYSILSRQGVPARKLHFFKALNRLVPVGTEVFVLLRAPGVQALGLQLTRTDRNREFLSGRLNVPTVKTPEPGKIYVTCMQKPILARSDASDVSCTTLVLDPWEAVLDVPEDASPVKYLITGA